MKGGLPAAGASDGAPMGEALASDGASMEALTSSRVEVLLGEVLARLDKLEKKLLSAHQSARSKNKREVDHNRTATR